LETLAAIDRFVATRLERHFSRATALAANRLVHLALPATTAVTAAAPTCVGAAAATAAAGCALRFTRGATIGTTVRFVLEAFGGKKLLLAGAKGELRIAVRAGQNLISVHALTGSLLGA
jgi:hypothetical protein